MNLGAPELMIVLVIILVIFGGSKLPKLAKSLGEARREFERADGDDLDDEAKAVSATSEADERLARAEREAELARKEAELARREAELDRSTNDKA